MEKAFPVWSKGKQGFLQLGFVVIREGLHDLIFAAWPYFSLLPTPTPWAQPCQHPANSLRAIVDPRHMLEQTLEEPPLPRITDLVEQGILRGEFGTEVLETALCSLLLSFRFSRIFCLEMVCTSSLSQGKKPWVGEEIFLVSNAWLPSRLLRILASSFQSWPTQYYVLIGQALWAWSRNGLFFPVFTSKNIFFYLDTQVASRKGAFMSCQKCSDAAAFVCVANYIGTSEADPTGLSQAKFLWTSRRPPKHTHIVFPELYLQEEACS